RLLRPGLLLDVAGFQPPRQALVVPELAVVQVGRDSFVYRVDGEGVVAQAPVRTGLRRDGLAEIVEGLEAGDRIVVEGTGKLRPGVEVVDATPAAPAPGGGEGEGNDDDGDDDDDDDNNNNNTGDAPVNGRD